MTPTLETKTKIIATIGPATSSREKLKELIMAGVDLCRINFSHGSHEENIAIIQNVRKLNAQLETNVGILCDLQGPKLRVGDMQNDEVMLVPGESISITNKKTLGTTEEIYIKYKRLAEDLQAGEPILMDDGKLVLEVERIIDKNHIVAKIIKGGLLKSRKGFNLPNTQLSIPALTGKDKKDLEVALNQDVDWIGLSFVRHPKDISQVHRLIEKAGVHTRVIAKIEKPQAIKNIDAIIDISDAVMVARGDLGVEMPMEQVPIIQKMIVKKCNKASKPVIIATQMMESMIENHQPTRAEASDVANAVMDGADAVMLSAETSVGKFPVEAVIAVEKILIATEELGDIYFKNYQPKESSKTFLSDEICFTAVQISRDINAKAIITMTQSGYTAFKIASLRPRCKVFIFTPNKALCNLLSLVWNVRVFYYDKLKSTDQTIKDVLRVLKEEKLLAVGDRVVHTASMPIMDHRKTNTLKISLVE
jgi:pyruvate kinase